MPVRACTHVHLVKCCFKCCLYAMSAVVQSAIASVVLPVTSFCARLTSERVPLGPVLELNMRSYSVELQLEKKA